MADPTDAARLDWIGKPGYAKARMDDVLTIMRQYDIRKAIDAARRDEETERIRVRQLLSGKGATE